MSATTGIKRIFENDSFTDTVQSADYSLESEQTVAMALGQFITFNFDPITPRRYFQFPGGAYQLQMFLQSFHVAADMASWTGVIKWDIDVNTYRYRMATHYVGTDYGVMHPLYYTVPIAPTERVNITLIGSAQVSSGTPNVTFNVAINFGFLYVVAHEPVKEIIRERPEGCNCGN